MLEAGTVVAERYVVHERLGAGGMGAVYLAQDEKLDRQVALKVIHREQVSGSSGRDRMLREARAAARLEHPGIVEIYDVGETDDGGAFLVMERIRGQSLRTLLADGLAREEALRVIRAVAEALEAAHAEGVIHRDVKPDNVMVRDDGRVVLLDFGLVKRVGAPLADTATPEEPDVARLTQSGAIVGTPAYLAPEQARGRAEPSTDQWSLAVTAFELLSGQLPWDGEDSTHILAQILLDPAARLSSRMDDVPGEVDAVLARALEKDPGARFGSVTELADALIDAFGVELPRPSEVGRRVSSASRTGHAAAPTPAPSSRSSSRWLWIGAALAVALGVGAYLANQRPDPPSEPAVAALGPDVTIACPVLRVEGVEAPSAFFGAAAATSVCWRVSWLRGGEEARTRWPVELLGLPVRAGADFPTDPYDETSREATLEAARADADAWIDGVVTRAEDGAVSVALTLESADGVIARGRGEGAAMHRAVTAALRELAASDPGLPVRATIDPSLAALSGASDPWAHVALQDAFDDGYYGLDPSQGCRAVVEGDTFHISTRADTARFCTLLGVDIAIPEVPLDEATPLGFLQTVAFHARAEPEADVDALIERLRAQRGELDERAANMSRLVEGELRLAQGDLIAARPLYLQLVETYPRIWEFRVMLVRSAADPNDERAVSVATSAWRPEIPEGWVNVGGDSESSAAALEAYRRAYLLGPGLPRNGAGYARTLLQEGRVADARAVGSRYLTTGRELYGRALLAQAEAREGRFATALDALQTAFASHDRIGRLADGDFQAWVFMVALSRLLERREALDAMLTRFVLSEPHRLYVRDIFYEPMVLLAAALASPEVGLQAVAVLEQLREASRSQLGTYQATGPLLAGVRAYLEGDLDGAIAAWRVLVTVQPSHLRAELFDEAGEYEIARRIDAPGLDDTRYGGLSSAHPREAARSEALGEIEPARALALRVIEAWETADTEVPAVARMRALLVRTEDYAD